MNWKIFLFDNKSPFQGKFYHRTFLYLTYLDKNRRNFKVIRRIYIYFQRKLRECCLTNATPKWRNNLEDDRCVTPIPFFLPQHPGASLPSEGVLLLLQASTDFPTARSPGLWRGERALARYSTSSALTVMILCWVNCYTPPRMNIPL